jgi:hypothetical protein
VGDWERDREQREVRVRVIELEARAARRFGVLEVGCIGSRGCRASRQGGARNLVQLGAREEGEQVFLTSSRRWMDESDEPLVDTGAVIQTVLGQGHDVGVIKGIDVAATDCFLGLRDQREGHLIDKPAFANAKLW